MSNDDVLLAKDLIAVRAAVARTRRRVLAAAVVTPLLAGLLVGLLAYYLKLHNVAAALFFSAFFVLLGVPVYIHWWRHYRSIFEQLDRLDQRAQNGEIIYGSQVAFHSYR